MSITEWNDKIKIEDIDYPCKICPMNTKHDVIIYWDNGLEESLFGKMEDNDCYKLGCLYFKQANDLEE